jgi:hypothetical protein
MPVNSAVFDVSIGADTILLNEETGELVLLNQIAAILWHGLNADTEPGEIVKLIAAQSGLDKARIQVDIDGILDRWHDLGILGSEVPGTSSDAPKESKGSGESLDRTMQMPAEKLACLGTFGVGDVEFKLHAMAPEVKQAAIQVFDHLRIDPVENCHFTLSVERQQIERAATRARWQV